MFLLALEITALSLVSYVVYKLGPPIWRSIRSPLRNLPGPPNPSFIFGQMKAIFKADNSVLQEEWVVKYGHTISYKGFFGSHRLFTMDTRALNHILTHSAEYQKPRLARENLGKLVGNGILVTEGEQHRQQRRILNPAFGPAQIRELTGVFVSKSLQLRDIWASCIAGKSTPTRIDVLAGLSRTTLDIIGLAGFNYQFDALNESGTPNELTAAFNTILTPENSMRFFPILQAIIPVLRVFKSERTRMLEDAQVVMRRIGMQLIAEKKAAIVRSQEKESLEKKDVHGRDLLTLLLKANMATDIPESQRLSDEDVLAQVPTFLVAGHETTSSATTWCLFALTQAPEVLAKLRQELLTVSTDEPTMEELNALPYLDAVIRETLRVHAPVPSTMRAATQDDVIPVSRPYIDIHGQPQNFIRVAKGDFMVIPILSINRSKELWGEDAFEFKPERWEHVPEAVANVPGVWGNMLTFLGGPRSCIGYRFSLVEMKALIFTLVRAFEFELAVPAGDIIKKSSVVQRPLVLSEIEKGSQMPLLVKPYIG
ncbi:cytochrome P450 [Abortiporus biennis]|nr:cytochrome P450 [Abortiporus biennis]